jgi:hypothetical protein
MAGLSNLIANTETKATTLPSWMNTAQQNVVNMATNAAGNVPQLQNTTAQGAINQLSGPQNPFTQAQTTLGQIASGAANPWIVTPQSAQMQSGAGFVGGGGDMGDDMGFPGTKYQGQPTGYNVAPNPNTALGGLFQAQNQQLQQLAPNIMAQPTATGIGTGQYGSLRSQTAADKALADAQAQLFTAQNQAALQNQQTGVQAGIGMGNVGSQYGSTATNLSNLQMAAPFAAASGLGKTIAGMGSVPTTETSSSQVSPLNQLIAAGGALQGGASGLNAFLNQIRPGTTISSLWDSIFGGGPSGTYIPNADPNLDNRDVGLIENTNPNYVAPLIPGEKI